MQVLEVIMQVPEEITGLEAIMQVPEVKMQVLGSNNACPGSDNAGPGSEMQVWKQ